MSPISMAKALPRRPDTKREEDSMTALVTYNPRAFLPKVDDSCVSVEAAIHIHTRTDVDWV
jgi:hypothetical protein